MTDQTTSTVGSRPGLAASARPGQAPSPRDLAARAPGREAATGVNPRRPDAGPSSAQPVQMTGAQALVAALERLGVDVVFGIPGGAILPAYDPLFDSDTVRHILVRHEQGAGHAAAGYAQATGRVGVCMATSGPGATNLVTPLADAYMDSVPVVAITGQVPSSLIGTDGFQEADISGITLPITKHNFLVTKADDIARTMAEAFHMASTGRPGPVLVDIAKDALQAQTQFRWPVPFDLPGYHPVTRPHSRQVREAARMMMAAPRPVLYVGGGVIKAGAAARTARAGRADRHARGHHADGARRVPGQPPQHLGMPGMHGTVAAVGALQKADLLIALGARFDDRVTGRLDTFAPEATVVHADIDPAEISKNRHADVPIVGDCREVITELIAAVDSRARGGAQGRPVRLVGAARRLARHLPARLRRAGRRHAGAAVRDRADRQDRRPGRGVRGGRRPAPDVGRAVHLLREPAAPGSTPAAWAPWVTPCPAAMGAKVGVPETARVGDRRRRLLPDDQPGAGHLRAGGHPDQGGDHQQRQPGHGAPVADAVLQRALLQTDLRPRAPGDSRAPGFPTSSSWPRRTAASGCAARRPPTWTP